MASIVIQGLLYRVSKRWVSIAWNTTQFGRYRFKVVRLCAYAIMVDSDTLTITITITVIIDNYHYFTTLIIAYT